MNIVNKTYEDAYEIGYEEGYEEGYSEGVIKGTASGSPPHSDIIFRIQNKIDSIRRDIKDIQDLINEK